MEIRNPEKANICQTCGTRYSAGKFNENECTVCADDRQYVNKNGQSWTSYAELKKKHTLKLNKIREDLYEISMQPSFAIGQKVHLLLRKEGNILWDCLPFLDEAAAAFIKSLGGIEAIAISHPHYYGLMAEWAREFQCPVYIHSADADWVMDEVEQLKLWKGESLRISDAVEIIRVGGHFPGSAVLHYQPSAQPPAIFVGDSFYLSHSKQFLSAMYSYPNNIPLKKDQLFRTFSKIEPLDFDALFGAFAWQNLYSEARTVMQNSLERYHEIYGK